MSICRACCQSDDQNDRVQELRAWADSRIRQCRTDEQKFKAGQLSIEAAQERMTLLAVLKIINGEA
jgi:hypothetical protein